MHLFYALHEALTMVLEEGLPARFARHRRNAAAFRAGIEALGLHVFAHPEVVSPTVTCIRLPAGLSATDFLRHLRQDHGLTTLPGLGEYRESVVRVGHMGVTATPRVILHALYAFEDVLRRLGHACPPGAGVARAAAVYAETDGA
ncbi:MAG: hypothetical protein KatS3mg131_2972 [Candidatus Tectimicrobiota bacterium]|nr:MAG: hypothetical protein KatS3mg131_2972 [Candidatus Tectomicrobia bacterium]